MELLRYAGEIRPEMNYFADLPDLKLDKEMVALAGELIAKKSSPFAPERYKDTYSDALKEMLAEKAKGHRISVQSEQDQPQTNVIDLMAALRNSLKAAAPPAAAPAPRKKAARASRSA